MKRSSGLKTSMSASIASQQLSMDTHHGQVEPLDPSPPGDLSGVEVHDVIVAAGDGGVLQQLAAGNLGVNHL